MNTFLEFFAGGGMAGLGLGPRRRCALANDNDPMKARAYLLNFGLAAPLYECDIADLTTADIPRGADLALASPPCVGFSEAGGRKGLDDPRSKCFLDFLRLVEALAREGRALPTVVIENVPRLLTSRGGADIARVLAPLEDAEYDCVVASIDAVRFVPQSRLRVFIIAVQRSLGVDVGAVVAQALKRLPERSEMTLTDVLQPDADVRWHTPAETEALLALMSDANRAKLDDALRRAKAEGAPVYGSGDRHTRYPKGKRTERLEVRFSGVASALRTIKGGSSWQFLVRVDPDGGVRSRRMTAREYARLMGLPDSYILPANEREAASLAGDGVVVPVVRWLAEQVIEPILAGAAESALALDASAVGRNRPVGSQHGPLAGLPDPAGLLEPLDAQEPS
jgi:DNA (cytosine-5)-methyltransferase 1